LGDASFPENGPGGVSRPKTGDLIADKYQIERFIGQGGMAEVFAGLNIRTGKRVALKWISPALATTKEALSRFRREALAAGRINHPNVVTVFDVVEHASSTWLVMELLEGDPLSEILNRVGYMEAEAAVQLLIPAIRGVAAAHAHGVIHRDLTPDNIFICRSADGKPREAKVLDFGVSKLADDSAADQVGITGLGHAVGTPAYMAPEQIRGNVPADARTDVYALGVVLYQMLAGRRPFDGQIYSALMIEIATSDPPALRSLQPHVPVALAAIVHRAMAREMEDRFPDVKSLLDAMEDLVRVEVSYAPNKISGSHSGRALTPAQLEAMDRIDSSSSSLSHPGRMVSMTPHAGLALAPEGSERTQLELEMMAAPVTPPLGSARPSLSRGDRGPSGWSRAAPIAAAVCLIFAVAALALVRARRDTAREEVAVTPAPARSLSPKVTTPPAAAASPEPPASSQLVVVVTPHAATIVIDGAVVEGNPFTGHYRRDQIHRIVASAAGFEPKTQEIVLAKDLIVAMTLDKRAPAAAIARTAVTRKTSWSRRAAQTATPETDVAPESPVIARASAPRPAVARVPAGPASSSAVVDPAGGRAPIHPIQTASPYEAK
jgi:serine/threonine protein kinase